MIISIIISSIISIGVCFAVAKEYKLTGKIQRYLIPFAAGSMLAAVFCDLLPEAIEATTEAQIHNVFYAALIGFVGFFILEILMHNFHHHPEVEDKHDHENHASSLIMIGGIMHTLIDGLVIGLAFLADEHIGIITAIAISAHKVPQEIGNFGILLKEKTKNTALAMISIISLSAMVGAILAYFVGEQLMQFMPELLGVTSGFFLYISASDIVPSIHKSKNRAKQVASFILGVAIISALIIISHQNMH